MISSDRPVAPAIQAREVTKLYRPPGGGLRAALARLFARTEGAATALRALDGITLEVGRGESLGLIGPNGAGKSTLLKAIGGITGITSGQLEVRGSIASLIEVGAGLHPDLTGRENIYLNASMMGLGKSRIEALLPRIIAFAGLGTHLERPVRGYSSGMVARLGFAVAIHVEPDVLLVDEVLSVGDMAFQAKSYERIQAEHRRGATLVFVSHSLPAVGALCDRVAWIEDGRLRALGPSLEVIRAYQADEEAKILQDSIESTLAPEDLVITQVETLDGAGSPSDTFGRQGSLRVRLHFRTPRPLPHPYFIVSVSSQGQSLFGAHMGLDGRQPAELEGEGVLDCEFEGLPLLPGVYEVGVQVRAHPGANYFAFRILKRFSVAYDLSEIGLVGDYVDTVRRGMSPVVVPYRWIWPAQAP